MLTKEDVKRAFKKAYENLSALSPEAFREELDKHKDGEILRYPGALGVDAKRMNIRNLTGLPLTISLEQSPDGGDGICIGPMDFGKKMEAENKKLREALENLSAMDCEECLCSEFAHKTLIDETHKDFNAN